MTDEPQARQPSCVDSPEPGLLPADYALERILEQLQPVSGTERVALREALGRVTAQDTLATLDVPGHTNSAVDGYALRGAELPEAQNRVFALTGTALAGRPWDGQVRPGECVRITTGAPMPSGADTVVMQEHVSEVPEGIQVGTGHRPGQNVRQAG
jgi:molybdopterin molybdotransferase